MRTNEEPIVHTVVLPASSFEVWQALTEVSHLRVWLFDTILTFRPEVDFETSFAVSTGERDFEHLWRVEEVALYQRLAIGWRYGGFPGDSLVLFELDDDPDGTRLTLTHTVREDFPADVPEFERESGAEGWRLLLDQRLPAMFDEPADSPDDGLTDWLQYD